VKKASQQRPVERRESSRATRLLLISTFHCASAAHRRPRPQRRWGSNPNKLPGDGEIHGSRFFLRSRGGREARTDWRGGRRAGGPDGARQLDRSGYRGRGGAGAGGSSPPLATGAGWWGGAGPGRVATGWTRVSVVTSEESDRRTGGGRREGTSPWDRRCTAEIGRLRWWQKSSASLHILVASWIWPAIWWLLLGF
jgi:hypothetical protein